MSSPIWAYRRSNAYGSQRDIRHRRHVKRRLCVASCGYCGVGATTQREAK